MPYTDEKLRSKVNDSSRSRSAVGWMLGVIFLVALCGVLFLYDGSKDATSRSGSNPPNVVSNSTVSNK